MKKLILYSHLQSAKQRLILVVLLLLLIYPSSITAQSVGLVLSGGGAKGVAHIGVIKALEEQNIPIDYVTGTSMGAIIGGMYAAGYSPDEMYEIISSEEFNNWIEYDIDRKMRFYFKNPREDVSFIKFYYSFINNNKDESNLSIPLAIKRPYLMDIVFLELFMSVSKNANYDFDNLFVPFRCVSADVADNKEVVFSKGDLGQAIRTSMSFPFYFKPIKVSGKLLFDGGMYNNFPIDVMENVFKPDIIIGSKVAADNQKPKSDDFVSQIETMLMKPPDYHIDSTKGVLIDSNIPRTNITDFSNSEAFIDSGYNKTNGLMDHIKSLVSRRVDEKELAKRRKEFARKRTDDVTIGQIKPHGLDNNQKEFIIQSIKPSKNDELSINHFKEAYFKLASDPRINYMFPTSKYNFETGKYDIDINVEEQEDLSILIGGNVSSKALNEMFLKFNYSKLGLISYSSYLQGHIGRFYSSGLLGIRLDNVKLFPFYVRGEVSYNNWDYFNSSTYFFDDKQPSYVIYDDKYLSVDAGIPSDISSVLSAGLAIGESESNYYQENNFTGSDTTDDTFYKYFTSWLKYEYNNFNRNIFPSEGMQLIAKAQFVRADENYNSGSTAPAYFEKTKQLRYYAFKAKFEYYFPKVFYTTWGLHIESVYSNQKKLTNYISSTLYASKFCPFPASKTRILSAYSDYAYLAGGLINVTSLANSLEVRSELYLYSPIRDIDKDDFFKKSEIKFFSKRYLMGSSALIYHTPIGPISLSVNYFPESNETWDFLFNLGVIIYNPQPLGW